MTSRREELLKLLEHFRISTNTYIPSEGDILMRLELVFLHLHTPFEDLQVFAGIEGPEQARLVYPAVLEWVKSESARKAVWYAGQIIRAAKALPRMTLQGPTAIMVYHASLALWVYGHLLDDAYPSNRLGAGLQHAQRVPLDGPDSLAGQRFIQIGTGRPCIQELPRLGCQLELPPTDIFLSHPDKVMGGVADILRENHIDSTRPRLVERLVQLMGRLATSTRRTNTVEVLS